MNRKRQETVTQGKRRHRLRKERLDELVEEAKVGAHDESEQAMGFPHNVEKTLRPPFDTEVLGTTLIVERIDITEDDRLVAVCGKRQASPTDLTPRLAAALNPATAGRGRVDTGISVVANRRQERRRFRLQSSGETR